MNDKNSSPLDFLLDDESFLRDFFENSPIGFHVFGPDQIICAMNRAELKMLDCEPQEIIGRKKWSDLIVPEQREQFQQHWKNISTIGSVTNLRYTLVAKGGQRVEVILNASGRFDSSGKLINTRGTVLDVSQLRRTNELSADSAIGLKREKEILEKHNQALNTLLANTELERQNLKNSVVINIEQLIVPLIRKLKRRGSTLDRRYLDLLEKNFNELTSAFGRKLINSNWRLTPREIEICNMIKNGLPTKDIADTLCISERTVEHHRNHIRKKLGFAKNAVNLAGYLKSL